MIDILNKLNLPNDHIFDIFMVEEGVWKVEADRQWVRTWKLDKTDHSP